MRKIAFLKPLFIHILISIFAIIIFSIVEGFDKLMINELSRNIIYIFETVVVILLYFILSFKFLKNLSNKTFINSIFIIILVNIILGLSGYLMMNYGNGVIAENGSFLLLVQLYFNGGFYPLISLINLPEVLDIILLSFVAPLSLYVASKKIEGIEK